MEEGSKNSVQPITETPPPPSSPASKEVDSSLASPQEPKPPLTAGEQTSPAKESQKEDLDIPRAIQKQFNLTEEQIKQLKEKGLDIFSLKPEDLADDKKRKELFEKLREIEGLSSEQMKKIEETEKILNEPNLSVEEIKKRIEEKRKEIESSSLSEEEKKQALEVLAEMEKDLEEEVPADPEKREIRKEAVKEKAKRYLQYAGLGLGFLAFIFLWQGLMSSKQQG